MARRRRSEQEPSGGSVTVVRGSIRNPDESDALSVKLSIWDSEVTMRANGTELGNWPAAAVGIRAIDSKSFEFTAEGDRLIFSPDNPEEFCRHPLVESGGLSRSGRKARRAPAAKRNGGQLAWHEDSPEEQQRRARGSGAKRAPAPDRETKPAARPKRSRGRSKLTAGAREEKPRREQKPSRRERRAALDAARDVALAAEAAVLESSPPQAEVPTPVESAPRVVPTPIPAAAPDAAEAPDIPAAAPDTAGAPDIPEQPVAPDPGAEPRRRAKLPRSVKSSRLARPPRRRRQRTRRTGPSRVEVLKQKRHEAWLFTLDMARRYDFLGLDRVPVDLSKRGQEHQHTWDHRVAATGGPGKYVCTICGALRRGASRT